MAEQAYAAPPTTRVISSDLSPFDPSIAVNLTAKLTCDLLNFLSLLSPELPRGIGKCFTPTIPRLNLVQQIKEKGHDLRNNYHSQKLTLYTLMRMGPVDIFDTGLELEAEVDAIPETCDPSARSHLSAKEVEFWIVAKVEDKPFDLLDSSLDVFGWVQLAERIYKPLDLQRPGWKQIMEGVQRILNRFTIDGEKVGPDWTEWNTIWDIDGDEWEDSTSVHEWRGCMQGDGDVRESVEMDAECLVPEVGSRQTWSDHNSDTARETGEDSWGQFEDDRELLTTADPWSAY